MSLPPKELSESALDALIARERTRVVAPLTEWHTLAPQLRAEGLIHGATQSEYTDYTERSFETASVPAVPRDTIGRQVWRWSARFAGGAALVGLGVVIGRGVSIGHEIAPAVKQVIAEGMADSASFKSEEQARKTLARAQGQYQRAAAYLAAHDTSPQIVGGPEMYQARLAALDEVLEATRTKLRTSPADPVLNQYYQSAVGAREATIQQLGKTLPAGARIEHY